MKSRIFMYLFIFTLLLVIFQYVNSKKILEDYESKLSKVEGQDMHCEDTINQLQDRILDLSQFKLDENESAMTYLEEQGYSISKVIPYIKDQLYELNLQKGEEHPLIPYVSMTNSKMAIDDIRILNHRWIIANFSDGKYWGEILLRYEFTDDKQLNFKLIDHLLYTKEY
ncbi:hydrolase [Mangrovimonas sp. ST2L15]|uniref:hydrolase n=1 Tax=Mangrovimonas sp. ST2L15 TaxID=1645916 RepID=UPI001E473162|nr:hydrolase [Mangrovimonas sp. ST2L15]